MMKEYEVCCVIDDELRWLGVEAHDEEEAINIVYQNADGEVEEIVEVGEVAE